MCIVFLIWILVVPAPCFVGGVILLNKIHGTASPAMLSVHIFLVSLLVSALAVLPMPFVDAVVLGTYYLRRERRTPIVERDEAE